jgi:hypothetical protein
MPTLPTTREIAERVARCRALREAWEPLALLVPAEERRADCSRLAKIESALAALGDHVRSAATAGPSEDPASIREVEALRSAFCDIDAELTGASKPLLDTLDACPTARRHDAWLGTGAPRPDGAAVLLDLVLEDEVALPARLAIVEDLVMVLATDEEDGSRRVARDPATLTTRLRSVCEHSAAGAGRDLAAAESALIDAARRCEQEPADVVALAVDAQRSELGIALLAPRVLRALIFFDAAFSRRLAVRSTLVGGADDDRAATSGVASSDPLPDSPAIASMAANAVGIRADAGGSAPEPVRWRISAQPAIAAPAPRPRRRRDVRSTAAGVVLAALVGVGLFSWLGADPIIHSVPRSELQALSPALDSGYRDQRGAGPLFIGTVAADWEFLPPDQRERNAWEIVDQLTDSGVREIVLYGSERRIAMHYADGLPIRITP